MVSPHYYQSKLNMMQNNAIAMLKLADHDEIVPDYATFLTDSFARYGAYTSKVR